MTDFCTLLETRRGFGRLSCRMSKGNGFAEETVESKPLHWKGQGFRAWIVNEEGKVNFCTIAGPGDAFVDCTVSMGSSFGETYRDVLDH